MCLSYVIEKFRQFRALPQICKKSKFSEKAIKGYCSICKGFHEF